MSTIQRLTLIGLYNFDSTLFDSLSLPSGFDKATFIDALLLEHGEKCVLYSDPAFMKYSIGAWGRKWALELSRIYDALTVEYNPIYNYDRFEEYTDNESRDYESKVNAGHTAKDTPNFSANTTTSDNVTTSQTTNRTSEKQVSAFNSSNYEPSEKTIENNGTTTNNGSGTNNTTTSGTTQDLTESSDSQTNDAESRTFEHSAHIYGNVGVTTSAAMVNEVVLQRFKYNLYGTAARLFANELLIGLY